MLLLDTDTRPQKAETMGVLVDWPGEQPAPSAFIFLASESNRPPVPRPRWPPSSRPAAARS